MKIEPCSVTGCQNTANQKHHQFKQDKVNKKMYGQKMLDAFTVPVCSDCHTSHNKIPQDMIWDERTFRIHAKEAGFELPIGSKTFNIKNFS